MGRDDFCWRFRLQIWKKAVKYRDWNQDIFNRVDMLGRNIPVAKICWGLSNIQTPTISGSLQSSYMFWRILHRSSTFNGLLISIQHPAVKDCMAYMPWDILIRKHCWWQQLGGHQNVKVATGSEGFFVVKRVLQKKDENDRWGFHMTSIVN